MNAQSSEPPATSPAPATTNLSEELARLTAAQLKALTELQAQQISTLKELEQARRDLAASIAESTSNNASNLAAISEMMTQQRQADLKIVRDAHRLGLAIVVGLSGLLLLSILILNLTSIRAVNRMTAMFSASSLLPGGEAQAIADAREASRQLLLFPGEQGQRQLGNALMQLHSRIEGLEKLATKLHSEPPPKPAPETAAAASVRAASAS
ncbi:MAG: hypothetical protein EPO07_17240 [Verrucomicrobia bacterium]|nr:MAG: hypothetical protein EPO07_17240 [Verrucomicrobiota bacterium]